MVQFSEISNTIDAEDVTTFINDGVLYIQSKCFYSGTGMPLFLVKINENLSYQAFHCGSSCTIDTVYSNNIYDCKRWSTIYEILRFLRCKEISKKSMIVLDHLKSMGKKEVGKKLFTPDTIVRAFDYFSTSRSLYGKFVDDYSLPSIRTLTRITSKVKKVEDLQFVKQILQALPIHQRKCILLIDEVHIKPSLTYHGGRLFGKAADNHNRLARTLCCILVKCLFGGPEFIAKAIPVSNLNAEFLHQQLEPLMQVIENSNGANVFAIITDGHRCNQRLFSQLSTGDLPPYKMNSNTFLMYDYVHLLKCIRNNWLTDKKGEIKFLHKHKEFKAKWSHLEELYHAECQNLLRLSKLSHTAVFPKPIERQKVETCLKVFCDQTIAALEAFSIIKGSSEYEGTILFLQIMVKFWKIVNVQGVGADWRFKDPLRAVIRDPQDQRLDFLLELADMAEGMKPTSNSSRKSQLTRETATFFQHICRGMVEIARKMLADGNKYAILGWFTTDPIEKSFGKLRQGSGGAYFITVQSSIEKLNIQSARLALKVGMEIPEKDGHKCSTCDRELSPEEEKVLDNIADLEENIQNTTMNAMVYVAGYVQNRGGTPEDIFDTKFYYQNYGHYLDSIDRGGLCIPVDRIVQFVVFCYLFFVNINRPLCRNFLKKTFNIISFKFKLECNEKHCTVLSNIFLNNFAQLSSPKSYKETQLKAIKLS